MNLAQPIRTALVSSPSITSLLAAYKGSFPVFTRRPIPDDAPKVTLVVSGDVSLSDEDGVDDQRPIIVRDVAVYGDNLKDYRTVEELGYAVRDLFHRQRPLTVAGWDVVDIRCSGPRPAPTDDEQTVGRVVTLTVRLAAQN